MSQHQSTSHSPKLNQLLPFDFYFLSHSFPCCSCQSLPCIPGLQELIAASPEGKELINHRQFFVPSSKRPQDLHPPGLRSLFLRRVITRSIAAFFDHQSPSDCTNHLFHPTFISYEATRHLPLFGFSPYFFFVSWCLVLFLAISPSSVFHRRLKQGHGVYNFSFASRGHLFIGKLSAPVAAVPKN